MKLLESIKFVMSAVSKIDSVPSLTHLIIENGYIRGFNGQLTLASPIDLSFSCKPKAVPFYNALTKCKEAIQLTLTPAGKLGVRSGSFRAYIECFTGEPSVAIPEGTVYPLVAQKLMSALKTVYPFIGTDTTRPWCLGAFLTEKAVLASNNPMGIEVAVDHGIPTIINIPKILITEMLRINAVPISVQLSEKSVTFHYANGQYMRSQLLPTNFPNFSKIFNVASTPSTIPSELFDGLVAIKPFVAKKSVNSPDVANDVVYFTEEGISSSDQPETGAQYTVPGLPAKGAYDLNTLMLLKGVATHADFTQYPRPMLFFGEGLHGGLLSIDY